MSIIAAIQDLKDTIAVDGFTDGLVREIAEDWEVQPALLTRKFEENFGVEPKDYQASAKVEIDYATKYNAAMARTWQYHPKMTWDVLTEEERDKVRVVLDRNLGNDQILVEWK